MESQDKEHNKSTNEKLAKLQALIKGCVCYDCDDLTDEELNELFEEAA